MPQRSAFGDRPRLPFLPRLTVVAATVVAGLLACGALLAALGGPVSSALAAPASGPVIYPGGVGCATTLQACIDNSPAGATIVVQANTYFTTGLTLNKAVSLTGVSSATVILHALANQRVLTVTGAAVDSSVIISGLTFAGGHAVGSNCPGGCGGAILITATAQPLLIDLTITNSVADGSGGGLYAGTLNPLVMSGVAVLSNTSTSDGGGTFATDNVTMNGGLFQNNQCTASHCSGGGLYVGNNLTATNSQFLSNTSSGRGGGARAGGDVTLNGGLFQNNQCTATGCGGGGIFSNNLAVTNTRFMSNTSKFSGGGAYSRFGNVTLIGGLFQNNQCTGTGCGGGGLYAYGNLTATNSQFQSNTSTDAGGGAFSEFGNVTLNAGLFQNNQCTGASCQGGGLFAGYTLAVTNTLFLGNRGQRGAGLYHASGDGRLVNDLFAANQATDQGDALYLGSAGNTSLLYTTIASPTVGGGAAVYVAAGTVGVTDTLIASYTVGIENAGGSVQEDYNLFAGVGAPLSPTASLGPHSHTGAAGFVNPLAGPSGYHLAPGSAAIDAGVDAGINFDIDGDPRPLGAGFDIGYDEANIRHLFLSLVKR